ncbi:PAS domain S-box protein [Mesorhizobium sp. B1-1-8]|uniref:PAS domain S-box protein n=1 Tax=Mesorhizobium sp. B1-1-8 TaxID=2589976 RepID=UPI00112D6369|nr:AAA family ATPase [Mesorhizobium sp. B1-1-8]UCI10704.1 PAS domain S-box protein [Mesorhizobium sp. B1-1-8]
MGGTVQGGLKRTARKVKGKQERSDSPGRRTISTLVGENASHAAWNDGDRILTPQIRQNEKGGPQLVLIVRLASAHPSRASIDRLTHEYGLKDELDSAWAAKPLELINDNGRSALILENFGGVPLHQIIGDRTDLRTRDLPNFLRVAISIAVTVGKLHERGLIHRDIKPANILVNEVEGQVRLTGFGVASCLLRERQVPEAPEIIAGTLAYMAPEQTGRMNRSVDSRCDLYAVGVTYYEMLTGRLPFTASEPMEWVHCHIARRPVPPSERVMEVPPTMSAIVMRLLAKNAEERYQTAAGLEADLRRALLDMESYGRIGEFALGAHDVSDRLLISERPYGREPEITALRAAFDRVVCLGRTELVLISGPAGTGKSMAANELHRALVPQGLFASGKFDQDQRDVPYASLAQALQGLVKTLLGKSEAELEPWRAWLAEALGASGQLMTTLVPELETLTGPQPPATELSPQDAKRRFHLIVRRLLAVFARAEHPLVLFFDDLQWLDAATLDLLEDLCTHRDLSYLLLIGAYRDNEVTASHPLIRRLAAIREAGELVREIRLMPLKLEDVGEMLADALHCGSKRVQPLARLVHQKSAGNPFFALQFLSTLPDEGLLEFDRAEARWKWNLERIRAKGYTDNVADLMLAKLRRLPAATQAALSMLACIGNRATVGTLTLIRDESEEAVHAVFWAAARAGLVLRQQKTYRFLHDRVQEAAYGLMPQSEQSAAHLAIGRLLLTHTPSNALEENIFEIVGQLNRGRTLIAGAKERERLADLNLVAARRAKAAAAYDSALAYACAGAALLPGDAWERRYELTFALELHRAESEFLTGASEEAEARLANLARRATSLTELARVTRLRVDLFMSLGRSDQAIVVGLDCLRRMGITWPAHPSKNRVRREYVQLWRQLGQRPIEALLDLPPMADPIALATMDVLTSLVTPALFTDENLRCLVIGRLGNVSLKYGNSDTSPYAYTAVGTVLGPYFGKYDAGFRFGLLGLDLVEQPEMHRLKARVYLAFGNLAKSSPRHVRTGRPLAQLVFETAQQVGDLTYAVLSRNNLLTYLLASGEPLPQVEGDAEAGLDFARQAGFGVAVGFITGQLQLIRSLRGLTPKFGCFNEAEFDELEFERRTDGKPGSCLYWIRKLQACALAGDHLAALAAAAKAEGLLWMTPAIFERADYHFFAGVSLAALSHEASPTESSRLRRAMAVHRRQLDQWAEHCPENFGSRAALINAETARLSNRLPDAERLYEKAIRLAHVSALPHDEAIAYERASAFYRQRGFDQIAHLYLQNARRCYARWGADGKVHQLNELFPQLRDDQPASVGTTTIETPVERLDLATVIKVSQAVSGEIMLEKLIDTVMRMALEQAGAGRGLLILSHGSGPRIAAEATTRGEAVLVELRDVPTVGTMPESVLHYVLRTREAVSLDDASAESSFAADPYIRNHAAQSILCLPLINHAKLIGALYLENNLAGHVFAQAGSTVLKLLASQAATALEITGLYRDLAEREGRIGRLVGANIIGIFIRDLDGGIVEANEAFLTMVGYGRDELIGGRLNEAYLTPPEWRERDVEAKAELQISGSVQPFEKEYQRRDGGRIPVLIGEASFEGTGNQAVAFVVDLSERKAAEEKVRASEARFRTFVDHATDAFFLHADNLTVIDVNRQACESLGYEREELIGMHPRDFDGGLDQQALATIVNRVDAGQTPTFETLHRRKDGTAFPVEVRVGKFQQAGQWFRLSLARDITSRKQAENALQLAQAELAHMSRLTTMGELAASIAHEVRQPLTGLVGSGNACLRYLDADPRDIVSARRAVERMIGDAFRASEVIDRIRAMAKKSPERRDRLSINDIVSETIALVSTDLQRGVVSLSTALSDDLPQIMGDQVQIQQVILNLIMNAKDAMTAVPKGSRKLLISTKRIAPETVLVAVRDSGPPIDSAKIDEMFEAFYSTKPNGMGLGLTISRSIIEAHNGRLWAVPSQPRGAIFQFTLPGEEKAD